MRLGVAVARLARGFRSTSSAHGLSPSQLSVLSTVVRAGPVGVSELAAGEGLNPTLLSRVVGRLEEQGLVAARARGRGPALRRRGANRGRPAHAGEDPRRAQRDAASSVSIG